LNNTSRTLSEAQSLDLRAYCTTLLQDFCAKTSGVQSATFATFDGVTVASTINGKTEGDKIAAMSSSISALAAALTREVHHPEPDRVLLESEHGRIVFIKIPAANAGIVFTAVTDHNTVLGTLLWNCRNTSERLANYAAKFLG
jgi:predicted regulator of Ras-like GTPase activity (Roadblock/LC7/MglB family)